MRGAPESRIFLGAPPYPTVLLRLCLGAAGVLNLTHNNSLVSVLGHQAQTGLGAQNRYGTDRLGHVAAEAGRGLCAEGAAASGGNGPVWTGPIPVSNAALLISCPISCRFLEVVLDQSQMSEVNNGVCVQCDPSRQKSVPGTNSRTGRNPKPSQMVTSSPAC